jgi:hypothetical protein
MVTSDAGKTAQPSAARRDRAGGSADIGISGRNTARSRGALVWLTPRDSSHRGDPRPARAFMRSATPKALPVRAPSATIKPLPN